jgi:hypothetical protein
VETRLTKLSFAISTTALVVAVLGVTPLGAAAGKAAHVVAKSSLGAIGSTSANVRRGPRGPRGRRGPRGFRGPRGMQGVQGAQGPKGDKGDRGDKGDIGPSNAYYSHGPILDGLPAGDYVVYGQLFDNNNTATSGTVFAIPGYRLDPEGSASSAAGSSYVAAGTQVTVPFEGIVHLPNGGGIGVTTGTFGLFQVDFIAVRVGSATP